MPHTIEQLQSLESATIAYVMLIDGIPLAFTSDTSGELGGSGGSSYIARAESDAGETVGGREIRAGLAMPDTLDMGGSVNSIGLDRTDARFSVLLDADTASYFVLSGEEPDEMLARLLPSTDPAPASLIGVDLHDRYIGLERIGPNGERHMFPFLIGEDLAGFDHLGDSDGALPSSAVTTRPSIHEGRMVAVYRVYRDPSATFTTGSLAWPSLADYEPLWVGKMRDAGRITAGSRITIECTGFESLLERTMGATATRPFIVSPEFTPEPGTDDQVAIVFAGESRRLVGNGFGSGDVMQGRAFTTLSGTTPAEISSSLATLIADTAAGSGTDHQTGFAALNDVENAAAGINGQGGIFIRKDADSTGAIQFITMRLIMHRRRWLALGFDPEQQSTEGLFQASSDAYSLPFRRLLPGTYDPIGIDINAGIGEVPGTGYYEGTFSTIAIGANNGGGSVGEWDNNGQDRVYLPLFEGVETPAVLNENGAQVLRIQSQTVPLLDQTNVARSGSIDGTDTDSAAFFLFKGRVRKAEYKGNDGSLIVDDEEEHGIVARCSWIADGVFASEAGGVLPAIYIEEIYDPRRYGYPYRPLGFDWAVQELEATQLYTTSSSAQIIQPASLALSTLLRSTGTSTGPDALGVIDQGVNSGAATGAYGDIMSASMGLGIPSALLPSSLEIDSAFSALPGGSLGDLARLMLVYDAAFPSYDAIRALLEPRGLRVGIDGGRLMFYQLRDASPEDATINILESDLYGTIGDPTSVWPEQQARALAPVDTWQIKYGRETLDVVARDAGAATRRGDNVRRVNGRGLVPVELYSEDPENLPTLGSSWKTEARQHLGDNEAAFLARRHGMVTIPVSRPKGQHLRPGTVVTISNPWVYGANGQQGVSGVVGRVLRTRHDTSSGACRADVLVFEGQFQPPALYAPALWIESADSTSATLATSTELYPAQVSGWLRPAWSPGAGGGLSATLLRMLPDGSWSEVGQATVASISATTVTFSGPLSGTPPEYAQTMVLVPSPYDDQPEWAQEIYASIGILGSNAGTRRFV